MSVLYIIELTSRSPSVMLCTTGMLITLYMYKRSYCSNPGLFRIIIKRTSNFDNTAKVLDSHRKVILIWAKRLIKFQKVSMRAKQVQ